MNHQTALLRKIYSIFILFGLTFAFLLWQFSTKAEHIKNIAEPEVIENYDIRNDKNKITRKIITAFIGQSAKTNAEIEQNRKQTVAAKIELRSKFPNLKIEYNDDLRIPEIISPDFGKSWDFLTAPSSRTRADILRSFLKQNSALFGLNELQIESLKPTADYTNPDGNLSFVQFDQKINEIPVFRGEVKAGFTKKNELIRIVNNLTPNLDDANISTDFGNIEQAIEAAAGYIGLQISEADTKRIEKGSNDLKITFERGQFTDSTTAEKMYFPVEKGVVRPAWCVLLWTKTDAYYVIVDAADGTLLWRKDITNYQTQPATYNVYGNLTSMMKTADSPTPFTPGCVTPLDCPEPPITARQNFTLIGNESPYTFNNTGWIPDGSNSTSGNNVTAGIDRDGINGVDAPVMGNPFRVFNFNYNPAPGNPPPGDNPLDTNFQNGAVTNLFYTVNRYHDELYRLGFTEAARNFQTDNFGRGGIGNDSISAESQDSAGTNNANFATPADGGRGRLQVFLWTSPNPDRDGELDNQQVVHELTHGTSNRLHGNASGLGTNMAGGMGEGWSDFYALALLSEPADNPSGTYPFAGYITSGLGGSNFYYGFDRFPYAIKNAVGSNGRPFNPLTFGNINAGNCSAFQSAFPPNQTGGTPCDQVRYIGEIWASALWEARYQLILQYGAAEGNRRALQYITDGMKLAPLNPTMLQERDAIIAAAAATDPNDVLAIRHGFAIRGMGYYASIQNTGTGNNTTIVTESFDILGNVLIGPGFSVSDAPGNNNGYPESGEPLILTVPLFNNTGASITGVILQVAGGGSAFYGDIANGQTVSQNVSFTVPRIILCGNQNYTLTFNINSSTGARTETRTIRLGVPVGPPPITFTSSTPVRIPGTGTGPGPADVYPTTINVSGLTTNKTIKLELTNLNTTYPGDMDWLLVGPGGQKFVVMSDVISAFTTQTNAVVVLKDDAASGLPDVGTVNMTGEWKPTDWNTGTDTFSTPAPAGPYQSPAPVGTATFASVFGTTGSALNGTWSLYGVDDVNGDFATIDGWKLTFEPNEYICTYVPNTKVRADFDGDGKTDISVFRPSEGNWYLNQSTGGFAALNWGLSGDQLAPGDFDGDNKTDFAIWRPNADASQPDFYVLNSSNFTYSGFSWGLPGDLPVIEDYDGDGKADIAVYRSSNHTFYVHNSTTGSILIFSYISFGAPIAGDFDGDGKGDFVTYSVNGWFISNSNINYSNVNFIRWGAAGDKPVPADYDGDGKDDFAVFRPSDRTWYLHRSSAGDAFVQFGLATDIPVPGDYDGDGKTDIAVYRDGTWYINRSTSGILITQFGLSTDIPIPSPYFP